MLYFLQHKMLPELLFSKKEVFVFALLKNAGKTLTFLWDSMVENLPEPETCPFLPADIKVYKKAVRSARGRGVIVALAFPEPNEPPMCRYVYFCWDESGQVAYFTSEKSINSPYLLCGWTESGCHLNYGKYIEGFGEELTEVEAMFWGEDE